MSLTRFAWFSISYMFSLYLKDSTDISLMYRRICFASSFAIKRSRRMEQIFYPWHSPLLVRKGVELSRKLFKIKITLRKVLITFIDIAFFLSFSNEFLTAFMPSSFGIFV